jgi:hypothetical protein
MGMFEIATAISIASSIYGATQAGKGQKGGTSGPSPVYPDAPTPGVGGSSGIDPMALLGMLEQSQALGRQERTANRTPLSSLIGGAPASPSQAPPNTGSPDFGLAEILAYLAQGNMG